MHLRVEATDRSSAGGHFRAIQKACPTWGGLLLMEVRGCRQPVHYQATTRPPTTLTAASQTTHTPTEPLHDEGGPCLAAGRGARACENNALGPEDCASLGDLRSPTAATASFAAR